MGKREKTLLPLFSIPIVPCTLTSYLSPQQKEASAQPDTMPPLKRMFKPGQSTELAETSFVLEAISLCHALAILSQEM